METVYIENTGARGGKSEGKLCVCVFRPMDAGNDPRLPSEPIQADNLDERVSYYIAARVMYRIFQRKPKRVVTSFISNRCCWVPQGKI